MTRTNLQDRFWPKVAKSDGCWEWTGCRRRGYGNIRFNGIAAAAHRVSWEMAFGEIPPGLWVLHHCDNPPCVRPDHLFLGTRSDNMVDASSKRRFPQQRLSVEAVRDIRRRRAAGEKLSLLAAEYGVTKSAIVHVFLRRTFRYVA